MLVKVKKLWLGHASVRQYIVEKCINEKKDLTIEVMGLRKTFRHSILKNYLGNTNGVKFRSSFNGRNYTLIDFPWGPTEQND